MRLKGIYNRGEILYNGFVPYRWETEYPADIREKCRFPWFLKSRKRDFYENETYNSRSGTAGHAVYSAGRSTGSGAGGWIWHEPYLSGGAYEKCRGRKCDQ